MINLCDYKTVKQIMAMFHLTFRKEFGQNFLTDRSVVESIAEECCMDENSTVLEIGPGIGTLTAELCRYRKEDNNRQKRRLPRIYRGNARGCQRSSYDEAYRYGSHRVYSRPSLINGT